jgi:hypothetical protein
MKFLQNGLRNFLQIIAEQQQESHKLKYSSSVPAKGRWNSWWDEFPFRWLFAM